MATCPMSPGLLMGAISSLGETTRKKLTVIGCNIFDAGTMAVGGITVMSLPLTVQSWICRRYLTAVWPMLLVSPPSACLTRQVSGLSLCHPQLPITELS